jgi:hypothetical protein
MKKRKYKCTDVVMLTSAGSVADHFVENKTALIGEDPLWKYPFINNFKIDVDKSLSKHLGIHSHQKIKEATSLVNGMKIQAIDDLSMIRTQLRRKYKNDPNRLILLLDSLGFSKCWKKARGVNSALVELLYAFQNNLSDDMKQELIAKGINPVRIESVITNASILKNAKVSQESLKGTAQLLTEEAVDDFNDIYDRMMDICEVGKRLFRTDEVRKKMFNFSNLVRTQIAEGLNDDEKDGKPVTTGSTTTTK